MTNALLSTHPPAATRRVIRATCFLLALALGQSALSAGDTDAPAPPDDHVFHEQLDALAARRSELTRQQEQQLAECANRFAVHDCENDVRRRFRQPLADVRQRELEVRNARRQARGERQMRQIGEAQRQRQTTAPATTSIRLSEEEKAAEVEAQRLQREQEAEARKQISQQRQNQKTARDAARENRAAAEQENLRRYEEKQRRASERKTRREQQNRENPDPAQPLPTPQP